MAGRFVASCLFLLPMVFSACVAVSCTEENDVLLVQELQLDNYSESTFPSTSGNRSIALHNATKWLLKQREPDWGWNGGVSTSSVILAIQVANDRWYHHGTLQTQLSIKQLQIELLSELARPGSHCRGDLLQTRLSHMPPGRQALYILALEATCHNTSDFHGNDLPEILEQNMKHFPKQNFSNYFQYSLAVLALCQSGNEVVRLKYIRELLHGQRPDGCYPLDSNSPDIASMALMAMVCAADSVPPAFRPQFDRKLNLTTSCILSKQRADFSFGNAISTALASEALTAASVDPTVWQPHETLLWVLESQNSADGGFGSLGATTQILPLLANRTYASVTAVKALCKRARQPESSQPDIETAPSTSSSTPLITIQLVIENQVDVSQDTLNISVTAPAGSTLFQFLEAAAENSHNLFRFTSRMTDFGHSIVSINGLASDFANSHYWSILIGPERTYATTGADGIIPVDKGVYIFSYKSYG